MGLRVYSAVFENVTISAIQDIFLLKAGAANGLEIHQIDLGAGGVTAPAEVRLRLKRLPATVTAGSGGSSLTGNATDSGDAKTSTATVRSNDTTQATTSGTAVVLAAHQWNVLTPWQYLPAPEDREAVQAGEALVLDIPGAPASTVVSGTIKWRELP
jgi:hypothetical protein